MEKQNYEQLQPHPAEKSLAEPQVVGHVRGPPCRREVQGPTAAGAVLDQKLHDAQVVVPLRWLVGRPDEDSPTKTNGGTGATGAACRTLHSM